MRMDEKREREGEKREREMRGERKGREKRGGKERIKRNI